MILQQLGKDADHLVDLPPPSYDWRPVKWVVHLEEDGWVHWPPEPMSGGEGRRDRGKPMLVPVRGRTSAIQPLLLADKVTYTWGMPTEHKRAREERAAYLDLLDRCAEETGNEDVALIARFLRAWDPRCYPLPEMQPDELTTFSVAGRFPVDDAAVRQFWARVASGGDAAGVPGQCLVCGQHTQVIERLPVLVKGIPGGQPSGVALVSANEDAFESYGRSAGLTSPICHACGERFGKATNALLQDDKKHLNVGPVAYLFWAPESDFDPVDFLRDPQPEDVRELLLSARVGRPPAPGDDTPFYATAVSAAISRAVFRGWLHTTVAEARRNLERWFRLQRLIGHDGQEGKSLSVFRLAVSLYRDAREMSARVPDSLLHVALNGGPLPAWLLAQAVRRNQAEQRVTYPRAALIKAVLCSQQKEDPTSMERLAPNNRDPAYLCGRLLAELEWIQRAAINPRATLVDRYYGTASSAPASVFGTLLRNAQAHLGKLRKERRGAEVRLQQQLEEILRDLDHWPPTLTLKDQALFALGYYHQRAENRRAAQEAKQKGLSQEEAPVELADDTEEGESDA